MNHDIWLTVIILLIAFPLLWCGILFSMSRVGPWQTLASQFPFVPADDHEWYWINHLGCRAGYYGNCLYALVTPDHITLKAILPFRPFHPPITIPRSAIRDVVVYTNGWWTPSVSFEAAGQRLTLSSTLAKASLWRTEPPSPS